MNSFITILALLWSVGAHASVVTIEEHHCVSASAAKTFQFLTDYNTYSSRPGAVYKIIGVDALKLTKSQRQSIKNDSTSRDDYLWLVLQPLNLTDGKLYPRFLLRCNASWSNSTDFTQTCEMQKDKQHFGLDDFSLSVQASAQDSQCSSGTGIQLQVILNGNSSDIQKIKDQAFKIAGPLAPMMDQLFNEESFFRSYYENTFKVWMKVLNR